MSAAEIPQVRPSFVRSLTTQKLVDRLIRVKVGDLVSYDDLSEAADIDVCSVNGRGAIASALAIMRKEHGVDFSVVRRIGYRRDTDVDRVDKTPAALRSAKRRIDRQIGVLDRVDEKNLQPSKRQEKQLYRAQMGVASVVAMQPREFQKVRPGPAADAVKEAMRASLKMLDKAAT